MFKLLLRSEPSMASTLLFTPEFFLGAKACKRSSHLVTANYVNAHVNAYMSASVSASASVNVNVSASVECKCESESKCECGCECECECECGGDVTFASLQSQ